MAATQDETLVAMAFCKEVFHGFNESDADLWLWRP